MEKLTSIIKSINFCLSDYVLVILLSLCGIYFSIRTRFVQVRCLKDGMRSLKASGKGAGISPVKALATAVGAQIGIGNMVGACSAILTGGPGALLWMWVISFFGMASIYAEAVLAQKTRITASDGSFTGGPVLYIQKAFPGKAGRLMAGFFAIATVISLGFAGSMVQSNAMAAACREAFNIPPWISGVIIAACCGLVFPGGIRRISALSEKIVPLMALIYMGGGIALIICRIRFLPEAIALIIKYAFRPDAIIGGSVGMALKTAVSQGVKRGLFSNEAGMGSTPHAHAAANADNPHDQGVVAMLGVFIDTFLVLTVTGLAVVTTLYAGNGPLGENAVPGAAEGITQDNMVSIAFGGMFGAGVSRVFVSVCLLLFAFSSIISWNYFGRINALYLRGKKAIPVYSAVSLIFIFVGCVINGDIVWELADMFNQLMVIPNVLALFKLSSTAAKAARHHKLKRNI